MLDVRATIWGRGKRANGQSVPRAFALLRRKRSSIAGKSSGISGKKATATARPTLSTLDVAHFLFGTKAQQITFIQHKGILTTSQTHACSAAIGLRRKGDFFI